MWQERNGLLFTQWCLMVLDSGDTTEFLSLFGELESNSPVSALTWLWFG